MVRVDLVNLDVLLRSVACLAVVFSTGCVITGPGPGTGTESTSVTATTSTSTDPTTTGTTTTTTATEGGTESTTVGPSGCGAPGSNSFVGEDGLCFCDMGFDWCTEDPDDFNCCEDGTSSSSGTDTGGECDPEPPPPPPCEDGQAWCTQTSECGAFGSEYYECIGGEWALADQSLLDDLCLLEGEGLMGLGCVDDLEAQEVDIVCGNGSGEQCDADACQEDGVTLDVCEQGVVVTAQDCDATCQDQTDPDTMEFYDFGECGDQGDGAQCLCGFNP